jgi:hypothetical protein
MPEEKDQVPAETKEGQSEEKQSEESIEEPKITLEETHELARALQKGYTLTRQEMAEMKEYLADISSKLQSTPQQGAEDEYLTVGKLKEILFQQSQQAEAIRQSADKRVETMVAQLHADGVISSKAEEDDLINFALKIQEPNLGKAAMIWKEVKSAKDEARKEVLRTKAKQEEGSKVGTSQKSASGEQAGVDYQKIKRMDWTQLGGI